MNASPRRRSSGAGLLFLFVIVIASGRQCNKPAPSTTHTVSTPVPVRNPIRDALRPDPAVEYRDGIAAVILMDTSGSMRESVRDSDGNMRRKIEIAQRAALGLVTQFDRYAGEHPDQNIFLGVYEFSDRGRGTPSCRPVIPLGKPDPASAQSAISQMRPDGETPIGDAMIVAKRDLDKSGLSKRHILVVTDGENNTGYSPANVTQVVSTQPDKDRASIYFVAFDVAAAKFNPVRDAGGVVLAASNESELTSNLDYLLAGKILVEQPLTK